MVTVGPLTSLNLIQTFLDRQTHPAVCLRVSHDAVQLMVHISQHSPQHPQRDAVERPSEPDRAGFRSQLCFRLPSSVKVSQPL